MSNILFDRQSLKVVGSNRSPLPFEVEVDNVSPENLSKVVSYFVKEDKLTEEGKNIYLLPQEPLKESFGKEVQVETIENTGVPVIIQVEKKVPLLDENKKQVQYEVTITDEETGEQLGTGTFIKCFTIELDEEQKKDENGLKLFYETEIVMEDVVTEVPALEITEEDEEFEGGLDKVQVEVEKTKTVTFEENSAEFTYEDIVAYKYQGIINASQLDDLIVETFSSESSIDFTYDNHNANTGFGFVNFPANGKAKTVQYELPSPQTTFSLLELEADEGIEIRYGNRPITKDNPLVLTTAVDKINFIIVNKADKPKDIRSFAIGY